MPAAWTAPPAPPLDPRGRVRAPSHAAAHPQLHRPFCSLGARATGLSAAPCSPSRAFAFAPGSRVFPPLSSLPAPPSPAAQTGRVGGWGQGLLIPEPSPMPRASVLCQSPVPPSVGPSAHFPTHLSCAPWSRAIPRASRRTEVPATLLTEFLNPPEPRSKNNRRAPRSARRPQCHRVWRTGGPGVATLTGWTRPPRHPGRAGEGAAESPPAGWLGDRGTEGSPLFPKTLRSPRRGRKA